MADTTQAQYAIFDAIFDVWQTRPKLGGLGDKAEKSKFKFKGVALLTYVCGNGLVQRTTAKHNQTSGPRKVSALLDQ